MPAFAAVTFGIVTEGWLPMKKPCGFVQLNDAPGISAADSDKVWPAHTGLLLAMTGCGGKLPTVMFPFTVVLPHAFVTVREIVGFPGALKQTAPGDADAEFAGVPPGKSQS